MRGKALERASCCIAPELAAQSCHLLPNYAHASCSMNPPLNTARQHEAYTAPSQRSLHSTAPWCATPPPPYPSAHAASRRALAPPLTA